MKILENDLFAFKFYKMKWIGLWIFEGMKDLKLIRKELFLDLLKDVK